MKQAWFATGVRSLFVGLHLCATGTVTALLSTPWPVQGQEPDVPMLRGRAGRIAERTAPSTSTLAAQSDEAYLAELTPDERANVMVYENCNKSVVNISTKTVHSNIMLFSTVSEGAGSGSVLDRSGHVLTNSHVVNGAEGIQVALHDGSSYEAKVVGQDPATDIAVLKIDAPAEVLFPVKWGNSTNLRVGQRVFAIGNPFGLERTMTTGIVSSLNRTLPTRTQRIIKQVIQIDAAINPGNSGGPLLDSHGRLIGMNTAIASSTGQSAGVGFAIPVSSIARVVPDLIEHGKVVRPDAGITNVLQLDKGLLIAAMAPRGPAEQAGLRGYRIVKKQRKQGPFTSETIEVDRTAADLIIAADGEKVATVNDFLSIVDAKQPGGEIVLTIVRGGKELQVPLRLSTSDQ
jgi:S1-C subfamily serine protease